MAPLIKEALEALDDIQEGDLEAIFLALEPHGYTRDSKAGSGFKQFQASTLVPPLNARQANLLKAVQGDQIGGVADEQDVASLLDENFSEPFKTARASPGYQSQGLRDLTKPLRLKSDSGQPLTLGDQLPLCGRRTFFLTFVYGACRLFNAQLSVGAQGALRGDAFMGLLGATGAGKTTSLLELLHLLREFVGAQGSRDVFDSIAKAAGLNNSEYQDTVFDALQRFAKDRLPIMCYLSLEKDCELIEQEPSLSIGTVFCVRLLYGSLCYLTPAVNSPLGEYTDFLKLPVVKRLLELPMTLSDLHSFWCRATNQSNVFHLLLICIDELNAAEADPGFEKDDSSRTWIQRALRDFLEHWISTQSYLQKCITLTIVASGSVSSTNLGVDASTGAMAKFVLLPLLAPSLRQQLNILAKLCQRARQQGEEKVPTVQAVMQSSQRFKSLLGQLSNFRLLSYVIALLGGCNLPGDVGGWSVGKQLATLPRSDVWSHQLPP